MVDTIMFDDIKKELPNEVKVININEFDIEVKQYLSIKDKIDLVTTVLNQLVQNELSFINPIQLEVCTNLEIIFRYTNIGFTTEQREDLQTLYDMLERQKMFDIIISQIPAEEYQFLINMIDETVKAYYSYSNSLKGIIGDVVANYSNLDLDATKIQEKLANPENLTLLKDVIDKLG